MIKKEMMTISITRTFIWW